MSHPSKTELHNGKTLYRYSLGDAAEGAPESKDAIRFGVGFVCRPVEQQWLSDCKKSSKTRKAGRNAELAGVGR